MQKSFSLFCILLGIILFGIYFIYMVLIAAAVLIVYYTVSYYYGRYKRNKNLPPEYRNMKLTDWDYYNLCYKKPKFPPDLFECTSVFKDPPYEWRFKDDLDLFDYEHYQLVVEGWDAVHPYKDHKKDWERWIHRFLDEEGNKFAKIFKKELLRGYR